jgi:predicted TIM-barrel fold metal-dependent hydrolase
VAKRLDRFPNFYVDISGCFGHIFAHALQDKNHVINFFETYQNRILYGSDWFVSKYNKRKWLILFCICFPQVYTELLFRYMCKIFEKHWLFLATDKMIKTGKLTKDKNSPKHIEGIKLSKKIVDRIFYENALSVYFNL